jgi:hypothetical protein
MFTPAMDAGRNGGDAMNGTSHDEHNDSEPTTTDLIMLGLFEEAAPRLEEGDEISRDILDNDEALALATYLVRTSKGRLHMERVGLVWMVVGPVPEEAIELAAIASMKAVA